MKIPHIVSHYNVPVPKRLSEQEFIRARNSLPIYPKPQNPLNEILKANWGYIFYILFPPLLMLFLVNGAPESISNHYSAIVRRNKITKSFLDAIYTSSNYEEYCEKYNEIE